jgi:DNA polymerase V
MDNEQLLSKIIEQVTTAQTDDLLELAKLAGLDPATDLAGANLSHTDLSHANLAATDLSDCDLRYANLYQANLTGANLDNANLVGANLNEAIFGSKSLIPIYSAPLFMVPVAAGFPAPAEDYIEAQLDLNQYLIRHQAATFFVRASGDSMIGAGIHSGDLLVVDRAIQPTDGSVVIAVVNGELTVKRLFKKGDRLQLLAENEQYAPLEINEHTEFQIWGVVTNSIHSLC